LKLTEQSILLHSVLMLWQRFCVLWRESACGRGWQRLCAVLNRALAQSRIIGFFRRNWDEDLGLGGSRLAALPGALAERCAQSGLSRLLQQSRLLSLLDRRAVLLGLCLTGFAIPFVPTLVLLLLTLATFALYAVNVFMGRMEVGRLGLVGLLGLLFAFCYAVSVVTGVAFPASAESGLMFLGLMTIAPVSAAVLKNERHRDIFLNALLISGALVALYGLYQYAIGVVADAAWVDSELYPELKTRVYATFGNPNVMGEYLIPVTCVAVGMLWKSKKPLARLYYLGIIGVMGLSLLATGSRGAMLGLAFAAFVFVLVADHRLIPLMLLAVAALPFVLPESIWVRFVAIVNGTDTSSLYRVAIYSSCFRMLKDYWLTGIGVGSFSLIYPLYFFTAANSYHAHNLFLQVGLELGVVGFAVFILLLIFWCQRLYRAIPGAEKPRRWLTGAVLAGLLGLLLQGLTDHLWFNYRIVLLFWLVVGLGLACAGKEEA